VNIFHRLISAVTDSGTAGQVSSTAWNNSLDIKRKVSVDSTVKSGCCALSISDFEISNGFQLEIESDAVMEIL
jgi:hypothetical protein